MKIQTSIFISAISSQQQQKQQQQQEQIQNIEPNEKKNAKNIIFNPVIFMGKKISLHNFQCPILSHLLSAKFIYLMESLKFIINQPPKHTLSYPLKISNF